MDLFKEFKSHSVAEFFKKNRHMLGFSGKVRSLTTVVHEYVTNSLDACEEAGILPEITVKLEQLGPEHYRVTVKDNGPGIPPKLVPRVFGEFLSGTKFHRLMQTRGQQGIGASGCTIFAQMTTGKPVKVRTGRGDGKVYEFEIMVDVKANKPVVVSKKAYEGEFRGTEVIAEFKEVQYNRGKYSILEYLRRTALANPHAYIVFFEPNGNKIVFPRSSETLPQLPKKIKPHPAGITVDDLIEIARYTKAQKIATMLLNELTGIGRKALKEIAELSGVDLEKSPRELSWSEAEKIVAAFRKIKFRAPPMNILSPIGAERIKKSLKQILKPDFVTAVERKPKVYRGGIPFKVEVGLAFGGEIKEFEIMRFANRSPLLFDSSACAITKAVEAIDWKRYGIDDLKQTPLVVFVNVSSVFIPYVSTGKQAIADVPEVYAEIKNAVMEAARNLRLYMSRVRKLKELEAKRRILERYAPEVARSIAIMAGVPEKEVLNLLKALVTEKLGVGGEEVAES